MRIGFDAKRAFHNFSGLGNYSRNTIQLLHKYYPDNNYYLYTPKPGNSFLNNDIKIVQPASKLNKKFKSYWRTFVLTEQLAKNTIDLYHGLSNELPFNINKTNIKSVVTIHDLIFLRFPNLYNTIDRIIYKKKFRYACKVSTKIIAISEQTKKDIINFFDTEESKISVIYQGCDPIYYEIISEEKKQQVRNKFNLPSNYLLYVGTIEERKNFLNIIKAVHKGEIDIPVVAIGRHTKYTTLVKDYISENSLKNIHLLGSVHLNDLPALYQMANLFVYPSVFEGFGIPILEALTSKVPVITSKGSCFSEAGGNSTIYIDPHNIEELTDAIKKVISDTELQEKMIQDGYKHAEKFRENLIAENLMNLYLSL